MIPKLSPKRLASLKGKRVYSTIAAPRKPVKRKKRKPSETLRIYGGKKRIEFVKSLPCSACGVVGFSENAHLTPKGEKGTGYKGAYRFIAPLCRTRIINGRFIAGCHPVYDNYRVDFYGRFPYFNASKSAEDTEQKWQEHITGESKK